MSQATPSGITPDEDRFVMALIEFGGNMSAAWNSVYDPDNPSPKNASAKARLLLSRPEIARRVMELQEIVQEGALISKASHLDQLARIRDASMMLGAVKVGLEAEVARGKVAGLYVEKKEVDHRRRVEIMFTEARTPVGVNEWSQMVGTKPKIAGEIVDVPVREITNE